MSEAKGHREDTKEQRQLTIEAQRIEGHPLFLRQTLADAEGDGFKIEIAANMGGGSVVVTFSEEGKDTWVSYVLTPHALANAVLALEKP